MEFEKRIPNDYEPLEEVFQKATDILASIQEHRHYLETSSKEDLLECWKNNLEDFLNEWSIVKNVEIKETYSFKATWNEIKSKLSLIKTNGQFLLTKDSKTVLEAIEDNLKLFTLNIPRIPDEIETNRQLKNDKRWIE